MGKNMNVLRYLEDTTSHASMNGMNKANGLSQMARTCYKTFVNGDYTRPISSARILDSWNNFKVIAEAKDFNQLSPEQFDELPLNPLRPNGKNKIFPISMLEGCFAWWAYIQKEKFGCTGHHLQKHSLKRFIVQIQYG
jgi:hypothetical protein